MCSRSISTSPCMARQVGIQNGAKPVPLEALDFADRMKALGAQTPGDDCTALLCSRPVPVPTKVGLLRIIT